MIQDTDLLSIQELRNKVELAQQAFLAFRAFPQEKIDAIVEAMGKRDVHTPGAWRNWPSRRPGTATSRTKSPRIC